MSEPKMTRDQFVRVMEERKRLTFYICNYFNWHDNDENAIVYCRNAIWRIVRSSDDGASGTVWFRAEVDPEEYADDEDVEDKLEFVGISHGHDFTMLRVVATSTDGCPCTYKFVFDNNLEIPGERIERQLKLVKD